jgi:hypothetical protein
MLDVYFSCVDVWAQAHKKHHLNTRVDDSKCVSISTRALIFCEGVLNRSVHPKNHNNEFDTTHFWLLHPYFWAMPELCVNIQVWSVIYRWRHCNLRFALVIMCPAFSSHQRLQSRLNQMDIYLYPTLWNFSTTVVRLNSLKHQLHQWNKGRHP